jgi:SAM-dependent methyltransferase
MCDVGCTIGIRNFHMHYMTRAPLHGTPIDNEDNLLDRFSNEERLGYYYTNFLATEKSLVNEKITDVIPRGKVLNVGCGRHGTERSLFPSPHYEIFGIDVSDESLQILQAKNLYNSVFQASISSLPFSPDSIDIVYLRLILHHLVYPNNIVGEGIDECFRVLKKGGILALIEPNSWHPIGALMNIAHKLGIDLYIHGTDDDVALSPLMLHKQLSRFGSSISSHAISYSWRRLPISLQFVIDRLHSSLRGPSEKLPYFGHTLMMIAQKC